MDISQMRREFESDGLNRSDLLDDPIKQFEQWFEQARSAGVLEPNAMSVATADEQGFPRVRTLLLKSVDQDGFVFYTNYHSRKGHDLAVNARACLLFPWLSLNRQVLVQGDVSQISEAESTEYFHSRPRGSQIGAWVSSQSQPAADRDMLEQKVREITERFEGQEVPKPDYWGGYRLKPSRIEFWQGRPSRLHDRFEYQRQDGDAWIIQRLQP